MIEVENLFFKYSTKSEDTIKGLSFSVSKGEIFGFLGPSGAGKSTTQKILIGILKKYRGSVKINNTELRKIKRAFYEKIGVSFELPNLYTKFSALENLQFFKSLYSGKTLDPMMLLESVGLEKDAKARVSDFSKGMKMRLNFCRSLLNDPDLLFLDEPTSGLDPVNAKIVKDIVLQKKSEGKTIFLTTHNMTVADNLCDRVAFIIDGNIKVIDSPRDLKVQNSTKKLIVEYRNPKNILSSEEFDITGLGSNNKFLNLLKEKEHEIETIHTQEATLEDIFIKTTGGSLS